MTTHKGTRIEQLIKSLLHEIKYRPTGSSLLTAQIDSIQNFFFAFSAWSTVYEKFITKVMSIRILISTLLFLVLTSMLHLLINIDQLSNLMYVYTVQSKSTHESSIWMSLSTHTHLFDMMYAVWRVGPEAWGIEFSQQLPLYVY